MKDVKYRKLVRSELDGSYVDAQFWKLQERIPWKAIGLATFLCLGGCCMLLLGTLLVTGYLDVKYADRTWPMLIIGFLMFLPGFYHVRIAYYAFKGYQGYSFDDIPEFE